MTEPNPPVYTREELAMRYGEAVFTLMISPAGLDGVAQMLRSDHPWIPGADFIANPGLAEALADFIDGWGCVCNVGVQDCPRHPGRLMDQEQKIAFRKAWDAKVGGQHDEAGSPQQQRPAP